MADILSNLASLMRGFFTSAIQQTKQQGTNVMMSPRNFVSQTIMGHEGGLSVDPDDTGNWFKGQLVGSKYGVTGATLAAYRRVRSVSAAQMAALTREEAISVAVSLYFDKPELDRLAWNAVTASILDMGYNAGPRTAIKLMQRMIGVAGDGVIGRFTIAAYDDYVADHGVEVTAQAYCERRINHYERIITRRPRNAKYRRGWQRRAKSFLPNTAWWSIFMGDGGAG